MPVPLGLCPDRGGLGRRREMRTIVQLRVPELAETNDYKYPRPGRTDPSMAPRIVVVSPIRVYREGLAQMLAQQSSINVVGAAARVNDLTPLFTAAAVDVVLFDLAVDGGLTALQGLGNNFELKVVVLGLNEDEGHIVACARAGIAGYITHDATLQDLMHRIRDAIVGEFSCPPRVAATLLRGLALSTLVESREISAMRLTPREWEIIQLIELGLSNKEIARRLTIQLATVKNHVHNILEKLAVRRRVDAVRVARSIEATPAIASGS
jgi:two-component system, NarL family, nitrate/nitrite response regulator NarL